jgi:hypothetical protein
LISFGEITDDTSSAIYLSSTSDITMNGRSGSDAFGDGIWVNDLQRTQTGLAAVVLMDVPTWAQTDFEYVTVVHVHVTHSFPSMKCD